MAPATFTVWLSTPGVGVAQLPTVSPQGLAYKADRFMYFDPAKMELVEVTWQP